MLEAASCFCVVLHAGEKFFIGYFTHMVGGVECNKVIRF